MSPLIAAGLLLAVLASALAGVLLFARRRRIAAADRPVDFEARAQRVAGFRRAMEAIKAAGAPWADAATAIVHETVAAAGAMAGCLGGIASDGSWRGVAVAGLFPPLVPLPPTGNGEPPSRAGLIDRVLRLPLERGGGLFAEFARAQEGTLIADARTDGRIARSAEPAWPIRSLVAAPLRAGERTIGVIVLADRLDGGAFAPADLALLRELAAIAGPVWAGSRPLG